MNKFICDKKQFSRNGQFTGSKRCPRFAQHHFYYHKSGAGFTIAEVLVAMGVFMILFSVAIGIFIQGLRSQRALVNLMAINNNSAIVLEQMAREMRTGHSFAVLGDSDGCSGENGFFPGLFFINHEGKNVSLFSENGSVKREEGIGFNGQGADVTTLSSENILVERLCFRLQERDEEEPWRATIVFGISSRLLGAGKGTINIQTSVSSRIWPEELIED